MNVRRAAYLLYVPLRAASGLLWAAGVLTHSGAESLKEWIQGKSYQPVLEYQISHEWTFEVGGELGRIAVMAVDEISNDAQLFKFAAMSCKAMRHLAATSLEGPLKERIYFHIAEGFLHEINRSVLKLPAETT